MSDANSDVETPQENTVGAQSADSDVFSPEEEDEMLERMAKTTSGRLGHRLSSLDMYLLEAKPEPEIYVLKSKESLRTKLEEVKEYENQHQLTDEERRASVCGSKRLEVSLARIEKNETLLSMIHMVSILRNMIEKLILSAKQRESAVREMNERRRSFTLLPPHRKGLGVLTRERKARLKQLLLQKAKEDLHNEQREMLKERENYLHRVCPPIDLGNMDDAELEELVKKLHTQAMSLESDLLDWEERLRAQEDEMHRLIQGTQEQRGRFAVPVLRKVRKKMSRKDKLMPLLEANQLHSNSVGMEANTGQK